MVNVAFHPDYEHKTSLGHRFPMEKYDLLRLQLLHEGTISEAQFFEPELILDETISKVHNGSYVERLKLLQLSKNEQRRSGFEHNEALIAREWRIMEGTRRCAELALEGKGVGFNIAGGTHHAFSNRAEGFCLLNDQAIASRWLVDNTSVKRVLIVDLDVHQGNGTAEMLKNDSNIFTFSIHGENNYPMHKEKSDLDIALPDGTGDKTYLSILERNLNEIANDFCPDFIFYQCGVDVLGTDKLGRLNLTKAGCVSRDKQLFSTAKQLMIPIVCTMGGGYSPDIRDIIETHANTFRTAMDFFG